MVLGIRIFPLQGSTSTEALEDVYTQSLVFQDNFQHACRNGVQITRCWRWAQESFSISSSVARSKTFIFDLISVFCTDGIYGTSSENLEWVVSILSTKYFKKLSQSDFTAVNSGRAGGGILRRMLFIIVP